MKNFLLLLLLVAGLNDAGYAQEAKAKAILAGVSNKYKSYDAVKATYSFTMTDKDKSKDTQQGTLFVQSKTNKYKVLMENQEITSDGKNLWTYLKQDKEVQVSMVDKAEDALNPAGIFTLYEKGFKSNYTGEKKSGAKTYQMIELTPLDAKKSYSKIRLGIDKTARQIANVLIFDKNGNQYAYIVKTFVPNVKVPAGTFGFDTKKYPDVEVVDLR